MGVGGWVNVSRIIIPVTSLDSTYLDYVDTSFVCVLHGYIQVYCIALIIPPPKPTRTHAHTPSPFYPTHDTLFFHQTFYPIPYRIGAQLARYNISYFSSLFFSPLLHSK